MWGGAVSAEGTASKAPWIELDPAGPNFEGQPPSRQPLIDAYAAALAKG